MLVLTRRIGEGIVIAGTIRVTVLSIKGKHARLGIAVPLTVPVTRMELLARDPLRRQQLGESGDSSQAESRTKKLASSPINRAPLRR